MAEVQAPSGGSAKDTILMSVSVLALLGGIWAFYWFDDQSLALRVALVVCGVVAGLGLAWVSSYGREFWLFAQAARVELRKVVWPDRDETVKTTYVVVIFAIILGVFFWALDWILTALTRYLTGQSG
jgi:preprotein translocase subunit SecE